MSEAHFPRIMKYLDDMHSRYHRSFSAFHVYETLNEALAPNVVGQEKAEENLEVIKRFGQFFLITKESLRTYFFLELAKLFDISKQSLQINKIINITESNFNKLTIDDFVDYNKDRPLLAELVKNYEGITKSNLLEIRDILEEEEIVIEKLRIYRDKWLAHDDLDKPEPPEINGLELDSLFDSFAKIMNIFTSNMNHESTMWNHVKDDSKFDTQNVLDYLYRFEKYRLEEIENEYQNELQNINQN